MQISKIFRTLVITTLICLVVQSSFSQKTEININAYTAVFGYGGNVTTTSSDLKASHITPEASTSNAYGKNGRFSYAAELQVQRVTKQKFIYGAGTAFEVLSSKVNIDTIRINDFDQKNYGADGESILKNTYMTVNPYFGKRILMSKITFDFLVGLDFGFVLNSQENIKARIKGTKDYETFENNRDKPLIDYRTRAQVKAYYKKAGLILGYSLGLTDNNKEPNTNASTRIVRLGLSYTL